jgi:hypothetical protein
VTAESSHPTLAETLAWCAKEAGLDLVAEAAWPEHDGDVEVPVLAGFVVSSFSPLAAEVANRCLGRRAADDAEEAPGQGPDSGDRATAVMLVTARGDVRSARHVADAVDAGARLGPLMFFQSVPNAVAGYIATRWHLAGPVVCLGDPAGASAAAALLLADGDADEALLVHVEQDPDRAAAVLVCLAAGVEADSDGDSGTGVPSSDQSPENPAAAPAAAPDAAPRSDAPHSPEGGRP